MLGAKRVNAPEATPPITTNPSNNEIIFAKASPKTIQKSFNISNAFFLQQNMLKVF